MCCLYDFHFYVMHMFYLHSFLVHLCNHKQWHYTLSFSLLIKAFVFICFSLLFECCSFIKSLLFSFCVYVYACVHLVLSYLILFLFSVYVIMYFTFSSLLCMWGRGVGILAGPIKPFHKVILLWISPQSNHNYCKVIENLKESVVNLAHSHQISLTLLYDLFGWNFISKVMDSVICSCPS